MASRRKRERSVPIKVDFFDRSSNDNVQRLAIGHDNVVLLHLNVHRRGLALLHHGHLLRRYDDMWMHTFRTNVSMSGTEDRVSTEPM
jgi:hypothetical protein